TRRASRWSSVRSWSPGLGSALELVHAALERAHRLDELGKVPDARLDALRLAERHGRIAEHALARLHRLGHARLGAHRRAVADLDVAHDADLAGQHHVVAQDGATRDAHLRDDDAILPDLHVVRDLDQVVDLAARADPRGAGRGAVDR